MSYGLLVEGFTYMYNDATGEMESAIFATIDFSLFFVHKVSDCYDTFESDVLEEPSAECAPTAEH